MTKNEIPVYGPAPVNNAGILNCFVQQPVANSPSEINGVVTLTECWKGPYSEGKNVLSTIRTEMLLSDFHLAIGESRISRYPAPECPTIKDDEGNPINGKWKITSIRVDELTAGDHCLITLECTPKYDTDEAIIQKTNVTWSLSWESYEVSPYEFCSGKSRKPIVISITDPTGYEEDWTLPANRSYIEKYFNNNPESSTIPNQPNLPLNFYREKNEYNSKQQLSMAESQVVKKLNLNRKCVYHRPVLTYSEQFKTNNLELLNIELADVAEELDAYIVDTWTVNNTSVPNGCPITVNPPYIVGQNNQKDWKWILTNDNITTIENPVPNSISEFVVTRQKIFVGVDELDNNFYGRTPFSKTENGTTNGRWYKNCL